MAGSYPLPFHHLTYPTIIAGATLDRVNVTALLTDLGRAQCGKPVQVCVDLEAVESRACPRDVGGEALWARPFGVGVVALLRGLTRVFEGFAVQMRALGWFDIALQGERATSPAESPLPTQR